MSAEQKPKITPLGGRIIATSRGVKEEMKCGLVVPEKFLRDSNVCTTEDGRTIIKQDLYGTKLGDGRYLLDPDGIIAEIRGAAVVPSDGWIVGRKCEDPDDGSGLILGAGRQNQFVEILAAGKKTGIEGREGALAYIDEEADPQKIEDTEDDWLIQIGEVRFIYVEE